MHSSASTSETQALSPSPLFQVPQLKYFLDALSHFAWLAGADGTVEYCNRAWREYAAFEDSPASYAALWKSLVWPDDWAAFESWYEDVVAGKVHLSPEVRLRSSDPTKDLHWYVLDIAPLRTGSLDSTVQWLGICTDISKLKETMVELKKSQERFRTIFESNIVGLVISDLDERILETNDAFLKIIGYSRAEVEAGQVTWSAITPPEYDTLDRSMVHQVLKLGYVQPFEKEYVRRDGTRVPVLVGAARINPESTTSISFALDISKQKATERRKDEFMGMASHELKTPLAVQKLYIHMLTKEVADQNLEGLSNLVQKIERQTEKLDTIVADMLDIVRVEADRIVLNRTVFDPDQLLREIIEEMSLVHTHSSMQVGGAVGASLYGDRERIGQVFTNLISNAVKYSPAGKPIVIHASQKDGKAEFCVQDFGIGIAKEDLPHVFDRFYRVEGASEHTYPGMGVGLFIACDILKRHQGRIWVTSKKGGGSSFYFELPLAEVGVLNPNSHEST